MIQFARIEYFFNWVVQNHQQCRKNPSGWLMFFPMRCIGSLRYKQRPLSSSESKVKPPQCHESPQEIRPALLFGANRPQMGPLILIEKAREIWQVQAPE